MGFKYLGCAKADRFPAVGSGTNVRFEHEHWQGAALELGDQLIHLVEPTGILVEPPFFWATSSIVGHCSGK